MSKRAKVLHRQTFQNSNNIVELTVKTIPKDVQPRKLPPNDPPYVRHCALKKELEKVTGKENNNNNKVKPSTAPKKARGSGGRVTVEVSKKSSSKKQHEVLPRNETWENVLRNCSTVANSDESDVSDHVPGPKRRPFVSGMRSQHGQLWHQRESQTPDTEQSNTSELIVNRQIQSDETSIQEIGPRKMQVDIREQVSRGRGRGNSSSSISSSNSRRIGTVPRIGEYEGRPPLYEGRPPLYEGRPPLVNNNAQMLATSGQPDHQLEQSKEPKVQGNNRLLSDDPNTSPFGESALQLLFQLRQRLQSRGDSEGMDIVSVVEAYITGQGSVGGVGAGGIPQSASVTSRICESVFPTPAANVPVYLDKQNNHIGGPKQLQCGEVNGQDNYASPVQQSHPDYYPSRLQPNSVASSNLCNKQKTDCINHNSHPSGNQMLQEEEEKRKQDDLRREIAKQQRIIAEQENDILQLRTLSTQLIVMQEKLSSHNQGVTRKGNGASRNASHSSQPAAKQTQAQECQTDDYQAERPTRDWSSNTPTSDRDYRSTLLLLQTENETLRKEVRRLREITLDLQNQIAKAYADLDSERQSRSCLSGLSSSKLSGSAPNLDLVDHHRGQTIPEKLVPSKHSSNHVESEVDSAYEEKTSSRLTSKVGSPHLDGQDGRELLVEKPVGFLSSSAKASRPERQTIGAINGTSNLHQQVHNDYGPSRETTAPSITRNITGSEQEVPVSQPSCPSLELRNSVSNIQRSNLLKSDLNLPKDQSKRVQSASSVSDDNNSNSGMPKESRNAPYSIATIDNINSDIAVLVSDIEHRQGQVIDDPVYPSFSTVSEESHPEALTNIENSFLQGIPFPRNTLGLDSVNREIDPSRDVIHSVNNFQTPTMESTRVQENSPTQVESSSADPSFLPIKGSNTFTSTILSTVQELQ